MVEEAARDDTSHSTRLLQRRRRRRRLPSVLRDEARADADDNSRVDTQKLRHGAEGTERGDADLGGV